MKGLKIMLLGFALIVLSLFCLWAARNYSVGLAFGIIFIILGALLMVVGLLVKDSLSELKKMKIVFESYDKKQQANKTAAEDTAEAENNEKKDGEAK